MTGDLPLTRDGPNSDRNRPEPAGTGRDLNTRTAAARNHGRPTVSGRLRLTGPDVMHWSAGSSRRLTSRTGEKGLAVIWTIIAASGERSSAEGSADRSDSQADRTLTPQHMADFTQNTSTP
ncbi:hypothetical protein MHU86_15652 [Fragilaria crotonensis]|nr:hypothetical protein MHU86_15652 [Fragilaria crotonensis]